MYQQLVKIITNLKARKEEYMGGFEERKGQEKMMCLYYYK